MGTSFLKFTERSAFFFLKLAFLCSLQTQIILAQSNTDIPSLALIQSTFSPYANLSSSHISGTAAGSMEVLCISIDASCPEIDNGSVQATPVSGTAPFVYIWNTGDTTPGLSEIGPGTYSVTVTDASGSSAQASAIVGIAPIPPLYVDMFDPICQDQPANFMAEAGFANYQWELNDPLDVILEGQGTHAITVKWGSSGPKNVRVNFNNTPEQCVGTVTFNTQVEKCAATKSAEQTKVIITPNPFSNYLELRLEDTTLTNISIQLTDIQGTVLIEEQMKGAHILLETEQLEPGPYFLSLLRGADVQMWRVMKQ